MNLDTLTPRQRDVYQTIVDFRREKGMSPTIREIGKAIGVVSPNGVLCHVRPMLKKGAIVKRGKHLSRSLVPACEVGERSADERLVELVEGLREIFRSERLGTVRDKLDALIERAVGRDGE
jgi:SOS-response transcriptional repressor LexA